MDNNIIDAHITTEQLKNGIEFGSDEHILEIGMAQPKSWISFYYFYFNAKFHSYKTKRIMIRNAQKLIEKYNLEYVKS